MPVPAEALAIMRTQRTESLGDSCVVTPAVAPGGTPVPFTVACSVTPPRGSMDGGGGNAIARRARFAVTFPWGTTIKTADRFTWQGKTLEMGQITDLSSYATAMHCDAIEVTA